VGWFAWSVGDHYDGHSSDSTAHRYSCYLSTTSLTYLQHLCRHNHRLAYKCEEDGGGGHDADQKLLRSDDLMLLYISLTHELTMPHHILLCISHLFGWDLHTQITSSHLSKKGWQTIYSHTTVKVRT